MSLVYIYFCWLLDSYVNYVLTNMVSCKFHVQSGKCEGNSLNISWADTGIGSLLGWIHFLKHSSPFVCCTQLAKGGKVACYSLISSQLRSLEGSVLGREIAKAITNSVSLLSWKPFARVVMNQLWLDVTWHKQLAKFNCILL